MKNSSNNKQSGAVSLFIVIFFMLLLTVVTVSFLRLMTADQQQSSNNDLSQSAYDSTQAGVEDAKRSLLAYKQYCNTHTLAECASAGNDTHLASKICNAALANGIGEMATTQASEVMVQQSNNDGSDLLDQAYTCVTILLETEDYVGNVAANETQLVPLVSDTPFNRVHVEWFSREDVSSNAVNLNDVDVTGQPLYTAGKWPVNRPSLLRAQLMQVAKTGFTLSNFDTVSGDQSNGATLFLYPTKEPNIGEREMTAIDQRKASPTADPIPKTGNLTPTKVSCKTSLSAGGYACSSTLVIPQAIGANDSTRNAFLRLTPLYNGTHFRVTLWNGAVIANNPPTALFKDVQPLIDSTGRANDLFRRVESRVDLFDTTFPYPEAAIDVTGNFCKDFAVTDTQYIEGTNGCKP